MEIGSRDRSYLMGASYCVTMRSRWCAGNGAAAKSPKRPECKGMSCAMDCQIVDPTPFEPVGWSSNSQSYR